MSAARSTLGALRLVHIFPSVTVVVAAVLLLFVARHGVPPGTLALQTVLVIGASQVAVGACNDYIDRFDDARTQPEKPLPSRQVGARTALALILGGIGVCCGVASTLGPASLGIAALGLCSGLAYDLRLKRTPFSPLAYVVSFLSLFTWIWLVAGALTPAIVLVYPLGACLLIAANLANALPDAATDASLGQRGPVVVLGPRRALRLVLLISAAAAVSGCILCLVLGVLLGVGSALASCALVAWAARKARGADLDRHTLQLVFRCVAPAIALSAASCLLAFQSVA